MKKTFILLSILAAASWASATTIFSASFEDGEVNPGGPDAITPSTVLNTTPYPTPASGTTIGLAGGSTLYGWKYLTNTGDASATAMITNAYSCAGSNSLRLQSARFRTDIPYTFVPNHTYTVSFRYMINDTVQTNKDVSLRVILKEFIDSTSNNVVIDEIAATQSGVVHSGLADGVWNTFRKSGVWTPAAGSPTNRLRIAIENWDGGTAQGVYIDDLQVTVEPIAYANVDDFTQYTDAAGPGDSNNILLTWVDGSSNGTGSAVSQEPLGKSMKLEYDNSASPYYSEASCSYVSGQDWYWTGYMKALEVYFCGEIDNDAESLYVVIGDADANAVVVCPDENIVQTDGGGYWRISLQEFADAGVDLANVRFLAVGLGDRNTPIAGGSGTIYIDHIKLYPERCLEEFWHAADFTGDCGIDINDLTMLMADWLKSEYDITAVAPNASLLAAYYAFDETSGATAYDGSGNAYHATVEAANPNLVWDSGGHNGGCIAFDGTFAVSAPSGVFAGMGDSVTVAVWVKGDINDAPWMVCPAEFGAGPIAPDSDPWDWVSWTPDSASAYNGQWNHYAFVKDGDANTMRIYHNGVFTGRNDAAEKALNGAAAGPTKIGASYDGGSRYKGRLDECRIYKYALSQAEIAYLAAGSGGEVHQPLLPVLSVADAMDDEIINLADFAVLAEAWLSDPLWL